MPALSHRVSLFTDSVIRRMTRISDEYGAINLSQGFPDFDPPKEILKRLEEVAFEGPHQYSVTFGAWKTSGRRWPESTGRPLAGPLTPRRRCWSPAAARRP